MKMCIDDMKLNIISPVEREVTAEEVEKETIKLLTIFAGIKQRVSRENKNHHQCVFLVRQ